MLGQTVAARRFHWIPKADRISGRLPPPNAFDFPSAETKNDASQLHPWFEGCKISKEPHAPFPLLLLPQQPRNCVVCFLFSFSLQILFLCSFPFRGREGEGVRDKVKAPLPARKKGIAKQGRGRRPAGSGLRPPSRTVRTNASGRPTTSGTQTTSGKPMKSASGTQ